MSIDTFPRTCGEAELLRLAADLNVPRNAGEDLDAFRARVVAAWDAIDGSAPAAPQPMILGGMSLGRS
jgi:hypothetical protein